MTECNRKTLTFSSLSRMKILADFNGGRLTSDSGALLLRWIASEPGASAMERCMAENFAFKVSIDMFSKLQSMGYLPRIPTNVVTHVVGGSGGDVIPTLEQLACRIKELDLVDQDLGVSDPVDQQRRRIIKELIEGGRSVAEIQQMIESEKDN